MSRQPREHASASVRPCGRNGEYRCLLLNFTLLLIDRLGWQEGDFLRSDFDAAARSIKLTPVTVPGIDTRSLMFRRGNARMRFHMGMRTDLPPRPAEGVRWQARQGVLTVVLPEWGDPVLRDPPTAHARGARQSPESLMRQAVLAVQSEDEREAMAMIECGATNLHLMDYFGWHGQLERINELRLRAAAALIERRRAERRAFQEGIA